MKQEITFENMHPECETGTLDYEDYEVKNKDEESLGSIGFSNKDSGYVFEPMEFTKLNRQKLFDISVFIKQLDANHKQKEKQETR